MADDGHMMRTPELIELAKKLVDESQIRKSKDDFGYDFEQIKDILEDIGVLKKAVKLISHINDSYPLSSFIYTMEFENNANKFISFVDMDVIEPNAPLNSDECSKIETMICTGVEWMFSLSDSFDKIIKSI